MWAPPCSAQRTSPGGLGSVEAGPLLGGSWPRVGLWAEADPGQLPGGCPSHMWGGGGCRFLGGVPLPIFALRGTGRAREYSAEATDLTQLFPTHTESAAKTSSAGPAQPSPADSGRTEPPTRPSALGPPESSLPALQPNPGPVSLGPPPGTPLTYPLPLSVSPDQRHCQLTHPRPPPGLALTLPTCPRALGTPVPAGPAHQHHTHSGPQTELPRASLLVQGYESTWQCRGHGLDSWSGESPLATGQLSP